MYGISLKEKIEFLVEIYYNNYDFLHNESLDSLKKKAVDKYLNSGLTINKIQEHLEEDVLRIRKDYNDNEKLIVNHNDIYDTLEELTYLLNLSNISYFVDGGLVAYIKYDTESSRFHDNINIIVDEDDFGSLISICNSLGIEVIDKGVSSINTNSNKIKIYASSFKKQEDGSYIKKTYDEKGNLRQEVINPSLSEIIFCGESVFFRNNKINIIPIEYIYYEKKKSISEKDKIDVSFLEDKIDKNKLASIEQYSQNSYDELNQMVNYNDNKNYIDSDSKEKVKEFTLDNKKAGYANSASLSGMSIIAMILTFITILLMYLTLR